MKSSVCFLVALALVLARSASVLAQSPGGSVPPDTAEATKGDRADRPDHRTTAKERLENRLDRMFDELSRAQTKERADRIAGHIMRRLTRSGSDTVDLLMDRAAIAMRTKNYGLALDLLDGVVRMEPGFAEGWNRRATVHFLAGDYGLSVSDIERTLELEPRHWGALVGLSVILVSVDSKEKAVEVMRRALKIHPHLDDTRERLERFEREVDGTEI